MQTLIGVGASANDGTGDPVRTGGQTVNANFTELYEDRYFTVTSGEALNAGDWVYVKSDGLAWKADASAVATAGSPIIGVADQTVSVTTSVRIQISGRRTDSGLTLGVPYYLSTTAGSKTLTAPTGNAEVVRIVGWGITATSFQINPSINHIEVGGTPITLNTQTGTTYTLVISDAQKIVEMNNASANTLTIPLNSSVAFPVGTVLDVVQIGAGLTTIRGASGVSINGTAEAGGGESDVASEGAWKGMSLYKRGTDAWAVLGGV